MVKSAAYIPQKGDLVWLNFNPQTGHEQSGRRPAIVVSNAKYNEKTGLALFCPITSREKSYPFEVKIRNSKIEGCILSDQIKSLDWKARYVEFINKVEADTLQETLLKIQLLFT
jgi:mRNA interferase MazF